MFRSVIIGCSVILILGQTAAADQPSAPAGLKAVVYSNTAAELFWQRSTEGAFARAYEITRDGSSLGVFDALSLFQNDLVMGQSYTYGVTALDNEGNRSTTSAVTFTSGVAQEGAEVSVDVPKPANLRKAVYSHSALELFWDRVQTEVLDYEVSINGISLGTTDGTSYFINELSSGQSYVFDVRAVRNGSARSEVSSIGYISSEQDPDTEDTIPPAGTDLIESPQNINLDIYSTTAAELSWTNTPDVQQTGSVEIYRNGSFIASSTGSSYYDDARPEDTNAIYSLVRVASDGQRSETVQFGQFETDMLDTNAGFLARNDYGKIAISGNVAVLPADREGRGDPDRLDGAVYVFTKTSDGVWMQSQKLLSDENAYRFGLFAAVDEDTLAISHRDNGDIQPEEGQIRGVSIYTLDSSGQWVISQRISAETEAPAYRFGNTIAISGDTMMIQANTNFDGSIVFVFERDSSGQWIQHQELTLDALDNGLGSAIDIHGNRALIGDYRDPTNGFLSGAAWIYEKDDSGRWVAQQQLQPDANLDNDFVGTSVALEDDVAILGGEKSGKVYIFTRDSSNNWNQTQTLRYVGAEGNPYTLPGTSVGLDDGNLVVGANAVSALGRLSGAAYVYERIDNQWEQQAILSSSNGRSGSAFGTAVAVDAGYFVSSAVPPFIGDKPPFFSSITAYAFDLR